MTREIPDIKQAWFAVRDDGKGRKITDKMKRLLNECREYCTEHGIEIRSTTSPQEYILPRSPQFTAFSTELIDIGNAIRHFHAALNTIFDDTSLSRRERPLVSI